MAAVQWHARNRDYARERERAWLEALPVEPGEYHPLKPITVTESKGRAAKAGAHKGSTSSLSTSVSTPSSAAPAGAAVLLDPLMSALEGSDPLTQIAMASAEPLGAVGDPNRDGEQRKRGSSTGLGSDFQNWAQKRPEILARYTTVEKLSLRLSMGADKDSGRHGAGAAVPEKVRSRLEELDDLEEGSQREMLNLSTQEYVGRVEEQGQALREAWATDQKVKALKIVIQCSKLLSDTSVISFYPSKFVLITDILDTFGRLVHDRIWAMCNEGRPPGAPALSPDSISPELVPDSARETCLNWFYKVASIRELVPRLYVEAAILRCSRFVKTSGFEEVLPRLAAMLRGVGDPLVAMFARAYICRVGVEGAPHRRELLTCNFFDFLLTFKQLQSNSVQNLLATQGLDMPMYLTLYSPAVDWVLQCLAYRAPETVLVEMMERCRKVGNSGLLLNSIMSAFRAEFIAARTTALIPMIKECDDSGFPKHLLFRSLGRSLAVADPPESDRLHVLNEAWKVITKLRSPQDYIGCAEAWMEYTCRHFTQREVNTVLADIIKHMTPDRAFEEAYPQLQSIVSRVLKYFQDFSTLFAMDKFLPFLDMFQKELVKVEVCKTVTEAFIKQQREETRDPVIVNALMSVCKTMHDSVNALSLDDERRVISALTCGFIRMISFGRDFEQQLSFYVEARATFTNLEPVLVALMHSVNRLAMETCRLVRGNHTRKTAAFVRACAAYCFITIPSLTSVFAQLNLYLLSGQVALANQCLSQADGFFKAAIALLVEVPRSVMVDGKARPTEPMLLEFLSSFLSTLLVVPDHPEHSVLYLVRGLLNVLQDYIWEEGSDGRARAYLSVMNLLAAASQETYLYSISKVDSNDSLYGSDPKFLGEVDRLCETILGQVLDQLKLLGKQEQYKRQSVLALALLDTLLLQADLRNNKLNQLTVSLWGLAQKHGQADSRALARVLELVRRQSARPELAHFAELALRMSPQGRP
ncbi:LOW QUALITY PROTEIN: VPS35 endosomal protein-sorting factor-like [Lethenteron reissneri]|uniref:LOW QUALITY PROTEIN: VPS35 endosomal protein-sorting factor-like n=1 Tax=Lethenteron reissneri TaxID=7753 RepID=UPI002AB76B7A|nr:LOW QUALITY PROTEIN: VPS35 endosomal protein-sorting factor-like [Lethenteron reissneri]